MSTNNRTANQRALEIIREREGLRLNSYKDRVGILTVGYGHTGPDVRAGMTISIERAEELLKQDIERFCRGVESLVTVPLSDNQFSALVCFSFNVGLGNLSSSTLLKKINTGDFASAADEFLRWNKAGGNVLPGLVLRREAERNLFLS